MTASPHDAVVGVLAADPAVPPPVHAAHLEEAEQLCSALAARGHAVRVEVAHPAELARWCEAAGRDPRAARSLQEFAERPQAEPVGYDGSVATILFVDGVLRAMDAAAAIAGEPPAELRERLVDRAGALLGDVEAVVGDRAVLTATVAGSAAATAPSELVSHSVAIVRDPDGTPRVADADAVVAILALGLLHGGGVLVRSLSGAADLPETHGWRLHDGTAERLAGGALSRLLPASRQRGADAA